MVQTGSGLRRSHRRSAMNLACSMLRLLPKVLTPTPPARQTQADASDAPLASTATAIASVAKPVLIIPVLPQPADAPEHPTKAWEPSGVEVECYRTTILDDHSLGRAARTTATPMSAPAQCKSLRLDPRCLDDRPPLFNIGFL